MSAVDILHDKVREARRFRYIPDDDGTGDALTRLMQDEWDTAEEFEARGGGDCDGMSLRTVQRAAEAAVDARGVSWCVVAGLVRQRGAWLGHMWCALIDEQGHELWADPTWGKEPAEPKWLSYPDERLPVRRWTHVVAGHFDDQRDYATAPATPTATDALACSFLAPLDVRKVADGQWQLLAPLPFRHPLIGELVVPAGRLTDFVSVPRAPVAYLLAGNCGHEAAVVHDECYRQGLYTREIADRLFADGLTVLGEPAWRVGLMYGAVRLLGESSYQGRTTS